MNIDERIKEKVAELADCFGVEPTTVSTYDLERAIRPAIVRAFIKKHNVLNLDAVPETVEGGKFGSKRIEWLPTTQEIEKAVKEFYAKKTDADAEREALQKIRVFSRSSYDLRHSEELPDGVTCVVDLSPDSLAFTVYAYRENEAADGLAYFYSPDEGLRKKFRDGVESALNNLRKTGAGSFSVGSIEFQKYKNGKCVMCGYPRMIADINEAIRRAMAGREHVLIRSKGAV